MVNSHKNKPRVAVIMGSSSDWPTMQKAAQALQDCGVSFEAQVISAHRTPAAMAHFAQTAVDSGFQVIIAGAGGAAHLPGMVAAFTVLPVIGVPVAVGPLQGKDALLSIAQMPQGVPVATMAIGGAYNAGLFAVQILAFGANKNDELIQKLHDKKALLRSQVQAMTLPEISSL